MNRLFQNDNPSATDLSLPPLSLMAPVPQKLNPPKSTVWEDDLGIDDLIRELTPERRYRSYVRTVLVSLVTDAEVIYWRQSVLADLLANPELVNTLEAALPELATLAQDSAMLGSRTRSLLLETSDRLSELDIYTELLASLHHALINASLESEALIQLRDNLAELIVKPDYINLRDSLPLMREPLQNIGSITVGINLDMNLKPISAVLMSINGRDIGQPPSLIDRLINGINSDDSSASLRGVAPIHAFARESEMRKYDPLFQDMDRLMQQTAKPIAHALKQYIRTTSANLVRLEPELAFYVAAVQMIQRLTAKGIAFCKPVVAQMENRITDITGLVNITLALTNNHKPISSNVQFDDTGRVAVLTGPNSGGKTTYLRNVGLAQVMFQAGLHVPAHQAKISPVTNLLTHFPRPENRLQGRLEEEASRLRTLFHQANEHSLVLLNETFSSTAFGEALYLAQDILSGLCAIGVRAVFATHLVELVERFSEIESNVEQRSSLVSLVAGIHLDDSGNAQPTYQITRRQPLGRSYAREIARQHGISLEQILSERHTH